MRISAAAPILLVALFVLAPAHSVLTSQSPAMDSARKAARDLVIDTTVDRNIAVFPVQPRYRPGDFVLIAEHKGDNGFLSSDIIGYKQPRAEIGLTSDNPVYEGGDEAHVTFETGHVGGYVVVFQVGPDGFARVIYPATPAEDNYVRGDQVISIAGPAGHGSFSVEPLGGTGLVLAMISRDHLELEGFAEDGAWKPTATRIDTPTGSSIGDNWGQLYWELMGMARTTTSSLFAAQVISYSVVDPIATHAQIFGPLLATDSLGLVPPRTNYTFASHDSSAAGRAAVWQAAQAAPFPTYCERLWTTVITTCCPDAGPYACDYSALFAEASPLTQSRSTFISQCYHPKSDGTCGKVDGPGPNQATPDGRLVSSAPPISIAHSPVVTPWRPPPIGTFAGGGEHPREAHSAGKNGGGAGSPQSSGGGFGPASSPGSTAFDRGGESHSYSGGSSRAEPSSSGGGYSGGGNSGGGYSGGGSSGGSAPRSEPASHYEPPSSSGPMSEPSRGNSSSGPASSGGESARPAGGGRPPLD